MAAMLADVAGRLAPSSRQTYGYGAAHFADWRNTASLALESVAHSNMIRYRQHLNDNYAKVTAARMLTVAKRLCKKAGQREVNPTDNVRGFTELAQETGHRALTKAEAHGLLASIDCTTRLGQRDYVKSCKVLDIPRPHP